MKLGAAVFFRAILVLMFMVLGVLPVFAQQRETIGWGRFFNNDYIGDKQDRWHTSSYTISRVRGPEWGGALPFEFGKILEFRFRADTITPADLVAPAASDRRYAGILSFGVHTHFRTPLREEVSFGADLVVIGPQTGVSRFQDFIHDGLGLPQATVFDDQFPNAVYPSITAELGHVIELGASVTARPFVESQLGVENLLRGGLDIMIGQLGRDDLMLRDQTTGQRYSAVQGPDRGGLSVNIGGDVARVFSSAYLPSGGAAQMSPIRYRLRAGLNWQRKQSFVFFGTTYLGPEFDQQSEGQFVGSLSLLIKF